MPRERKQTETFAPEVSEPVKRAKKVSAIYFLDIGISNEASTCVEIRDDPHTATEWAKGELP
jgi:hypothetical protein